MTRYRINGRDVTEEEFRAAGTPGRLEEMLAARSPPMSNTDREFLEGRGGCHDQFQGSPQGEFYRRAAAAAGVDTAGRVYLSSLAAYPGDPVAWVSGRGDVRRVCEERGWGCRGAVDVPVRAEEPAPAVPLAPDILAREAAARVAAAEAQAGGPLAPREAADLAGRAAAELTPHWARGGSGG
jgi:hypothetical protein